MPNIRIPETCAAVLSVHNSQITAERNVHFEAFALVKADGVDFLNSRKAQFVVAERPGSLRWSL